MTTYKELQSQIERLQQEAELARKTEFQSPFSKTFRVVRILQPLAETMREL